MAVPVCKSVSFQFFCYFRSSGGKKSSCMYHYSSSPHANTFKCLIVPFTVNPIEVAVTVWSLLPLWLSKYTHIAFSTYNKHMTFFILIHTQRGKEREYKQAVWAQKHARVSMYMYVCMFAHPMWLCQNKALKIVYILNVIRSLYQFFAPSSSSSSSSTTVFQNFRRWFYFLVCRFSALSFKSHKLPNLYRIF